MAPGGGSPVLSQPSCFPAPGPAPIIPASRSFVYVLTLHPTQSPPRVLTGPQLPVHLQLGTGCERDPAVATGQEEVSRPGLNLMLKKAGSRVFSTVPATPDGAGDERGRLRPVASEENEVASREDLQDFRG